MLVTKKRMVYITIALTVIFFIPLFHLPESIVGDRGDNILLFAPKILFLSLTAALAAAITIVLLFKREYLRWQLDTFNRFKNLLRLQVKRDFVKRYRKSVLGVLWSLLNPMLTMLVMTFVFSNLFARDVPNFPVYLLSGQLVFFFFSEATNSALGSVIASEGIIKKVYVPKYIFPLSKVLSSLVNLLFSFIAFIIVFVVTGQQFQWTMLLIPLPIIYTFIFALGIALLLSSMAVFFRDLQYLWGVFITLLTFMTPLFYPVEIIPERWLPFYNLNPMYHFVDFFREVALNGNIPDIWSNIVCIGYALAALCVGTVVFMKQQDKYILYI